MEDIHALYVGALTFLDSATYEMLLFDEELVDHCIHEEDVARHHCHE